MQLSALRAVVLAAALVIASCSENDRTTVKGAPALALASACAGDTQCESGFCDRLRCAQPQGVYGRPCIPAPRTSDGFRDGKLHTCGAYLCLDERCRSCSTDEQCRSTLGSPKCTPSGDRPGARCGHPPGSR